MADPAKVKQLCDELGVSQEEAVSYLEEHNWDLAMATAACHQKLVPLVPFKSSPRVSLDKKFAEAESSSKTVPGEEEPTPELKKELIDKFREVALWVSPKEAHDLLKQFNWNVELAANHFMEMQDSKTKSDSDSDDEGDRLRYNDDPPPPLTDHSHLRPSSGLMNVMMANVGNLLKNVDETLLASSHLQIQKSSIPAQIREEELLPPIKVDRVCNTLGVARQEALYYVDGFNGNLAPAMEACRIKTLLPLMVNEKPASQVLIKKTDLIRFFCNATGASEDDAMDCLNHCKWIGDDAVGYFFDKCSGNLNSQRIPEGDHSRTGQSSSQCPTEGGTGFSEDVASKALTSERKAQIIRSFCDVTQASPADAVRCLNECNWNEDGAIGYLMDGNLNSKSISEGDRSITGFSEGVASKGLASEIPLMGLPSQSQLQAPFGSSSSSMNIDPTETEELLREARGESVTTITPMRSSQVDNKLKGKAVEDDSSTETCPNMMTIEIAFPDQTAVNIPFRSDQTVRDIRNAIDALIPDESRNYSLWSKTSKVFDDLNTSVATISTCEEYKDLNISLMLVYP